MKRCLASLSIVAVAGAAFLAGAVFAGASRAAALVLVVVILHLLRLLVAAMPATIYWVGFTGGRYCRHYGHNQFKASY